MSNENFSQNPTIGGRRIKGGNPTNQFILQYNDTTKLWEFVAIPAATIGGKAIEAGPPLNGETLQFNSGTNLWEFVTPSVSMSELEFLQGKDAAGKMRNVNGSLLQPALPADLLTITPPIGVTTVVYKAGFNISDNNIGNAELQLIIDGVTIEDRFIGGVTIAPPTYVDFITKGKQLVGDGAKTIRVRCNSYGGTAVGRVSASIECYDL